ncbi:hypothetical protein PHYBLDRAFT_148442 [Phycomyces blakesleeanus NRRL 1555(-)]|uniref:Uncharacterized protein n=1 Tax=Phycomyces blakesleeanus (strain ATCC 8743b / DSM 1359 / FGSC 10004 / NBRC 33097 / NRRL 1555) TaxID=763407 RepID=A0A162PF83_PHYB8|nr:hypothetical protein PHYBLDRAFT_153784 [Phycomyces blakesleeanus NRRL 1555(-)]XP_018288567.1 hypothetical protein PHYBLDRAFT_148442 [Phycomyces blakesleeanus NRRL 1555(-)]OAD65126.1 hypothetical protein PHYBLDRAFT_153784 [Phycomyces blakesleeanus NRRL 1555(-)]OAD70527.1 hypothetical protein PHYBLDRAFT_148442 [Phycomyces blakesleeanus NRRL 1555(-)]|eukprot:XP_018283166.1 hypothetical protein PHYBLDRAFT_153784 [Phycomyces blakesleeanus NRRL 1555(-)]
MLHEKLEEYNSAFEKIMEELEEPEMPEDPKSSALSTTDETPKKSRGQYQKPMDKDIKKLVYLYFIRGLTIEKASKIVNMKQTTAGGYILKWRKSPVVFFIKNNKEATSDEKMNLLFETYSAIKKAYK